MHMRDLLERIAQSARRIDSAIGRNIGSRNGLLQQGDRFETLFPGSMQYIADGAGGNIAAGRDALIHNAEVVAEMTRAALGNDWKKARTLHRRFLPLMQANFMESNPIPVKAVLAMMGRIEEVYRLPLVPMKPENRARLEKIAGEVGVLAATAAVKS